jgi:hypothetical protein
MKTFDEAVAVLSDTCKEIGGFRHQYCRCDDINNSKLLIEQLDARATIIMMCVAASNSGAEAHKILLENLAIALEMGIAIGMLMERNELP